MEALEERVVMVTGAPLPQLPLHIIISSSAESLTLNQAIGLVNSPASFWANNLPGSEQTYLVGHGLVSTNTASATQNLITFSGVSGAIELGGTSLQVAAGVNLAVQGPGAASLAWNGGGQSQVLGIAPGATVSISGVTIEGGNGQGGTGTGGGIENNGTLTLTNTAVSNNTSSATAGRNPQYRDVDDHR